MRYVVGGRKKQSARSPSLPVSLSLREGPPRDSSVTCLRRRIERPRGRTCERVGQGRGAEVKTVKSIQRFVLSDAKRVRRDKTVGRGSLPSLVVKFSEHAFLPPSPRGCLRASTNSASNSLPFLAVTLVRGCERKLVVFKRKKKSDQRGRVYLF